MYQIVLFLRLTRHPGCSRDVLWLSNFGSFPVSAAYRARALYSKNLVIRSCLDLYLVEKQRLQRQLHLIWAGCY